MWYDETHNRHGEAPLPEQKYDDVKDIDRLINLPDEALHRNVDKIVLAANSAAVKTAVISPPTIYGVGKGPVNTRSIQVPDLVRFTLEKGFAPILGPGKAEWDNVHVHDLGEFLVSISEATQDPALNSNPEILGPKGYFIIENGTHTWANIATLVAEQACKQGFLPAPLTKTTTMKEAVEAGGVANNSWGLNSKGVTSRAKKFLGWKPTGRRMEEEVPDLVASEAKKMNLEPHEKITA
jgi:nucleoside-diphosphate-sugar epimerase